MFVKSYRPDTVLLKSQKNFKSRSQLPILIRYTPLHQDEHVTKIS